VPPRAGRPRLTRNVFDFEDTSTSAPSDAVLDTSFIVNALIPSEPLHAASNAFMLALVQASTTIYYNRLVELELAETAFKIAVKEQHGPKAWPSKRTDGRVRRRAGRLTTALLQSWNDLLSTTPHLCVELHEVVDEVPSIMTRYGLASMDAAHAATAAYVGDVAMVTCDAGFGAVPERSLPLYVDASRVRSVRRRRGGAA
jgi:predicted nucleic acid-binding protein